MYFAKMAPTNMSTHARNIPEILERGTRLSRRELLGWVLASAAASRAGRLWAAVKKAPPLPLRPLGKTAWKASLLGFGASPISGLSKKKGSDVVRRAVDLGINYIDTASTYGDHTSEAAVGAALAGKRRSKVFLGTKIVERSRKGSSAEFKASMEHLNTEPDLIQIHAVNDSRTLDAVMAKGGSLETALDLKKKGYARFIGITGHTRPEVILKALERYPFDSVLIPLSAADHHLASFEPVMKKANELGIAVVAMKVLAGGRAVGKLSIDELLHYSFSLPISTAVIGMKDEAEIEENVRSTRAFKPLGERKIRRILKKAKSLGNKDVLWWKR